MLNNCPEAEYNWIKTAKDAEHNGIPKMVRQTRGINQFGPVTVDKYKFSFEINPEKDREISKALLKVWKDKGTSMWSWHSSRNNPFKTAYISLQDAKTSKILTSEVIEIDSKPGWVRLDITNFIKEMTDTDEEFVDLNVLIESLSSHRSAIAAARKVRLINQETTVRKRRPSLFVKTKKAKVKTSIEKSRVCKNNGFKVSDLFQNTKQSCCKNKQVINLKDLRWHSNIIVEPQYVEMAQCGGKCSGSRECIPIEHKSLTIMYLSKNENDEIVEKIDVVPDFIVTKCGCRYVL